MIITYTLILVISILFIVFSIFKIHLRKESFQYSTDNLNSHIPKVIISTYYRKDLIPNKVYSNIKKFAPGYKYIIFDDQEIIIFFKKYYPPLVLESFYKLTGAHKADLFRYCYLYIYGGIYLDIKTELIKNIDNIFNKPNVKLYTVLSMFSKTIYQGIIATVPNNPLFKELINHMVTIRKPVTNYFAFTSKFYKSLQVACGSEIYKKYNKNNVYLFYEKCSVNKSDCHDGLDRYKRCCYVYDNNMRIIKTRYSDYPW